MSSSIALHHGFVWIYFIVCVFMGHSTHVGKSGRLIGVSCLLLPSGSLTET